MVRGASPVARAKRMAGWLRRPVMLCGSMVKTGLLHPPPPPPPLVFTVTVTALLCAALGQPLVISTQYVLVCVSAGVVKVAKVAPSTGLLRSSFCPSYHWMKKGVVPEACTLMVKVWPELIAP